jgi:hypothetical protein
MTALVLSDIKGALPYQGMPPFAITGIVLVAGIILVAFAILRKKHSAMAEISVTEPYSAIKALELLQNEYQQEGLAADPLFCRLADLVFFGLTGAVRQTSEEILRRASRANYSADNINLASSLLLLCDQVKFARHQPSPEEISRAFDSAFALTKSSAGEVR